jgi:subtilisin family serine protease
VSSSLPRQEMALAYPAAYPEVIAVTAVDRNKRSYAEANHGTYIDMAAPGVRIWTALPNNQQGMLSGTSFAAPFVTAIAAATYDTIPMKPARDWPCSIRKLSCSRA